MLIVGRCYREKDNGNFLTSNFVFIISTRLYTQILTPGILMRNLGHVL